MADTTVQGLPAQVKVDCRVLILGSMPGVASLQAGCYYAHPRNRFWPLMGALCNFDPQWAYDQRMAALQAAGVGLWDVIGRCERRGSLDSAIVRGSEVVNPLPALIQRLPHLQLVACNGASAAQAFRRFVQPQLAVDAARLPLLALPSTSPANAAWSMARLLQDWQQLEPALSAPAR